MIIALAGRKQSGKTILADVAKNLSFTKLSFAKPLKDISCYILGVNMETLNSLKTKEINFEFTPTTIRLFSEKSNLPYEAIAKLCLGKTVKTGREFMQFIGTDIIRNIDPDWHIKQLDGIIKEEGNYIFDDLRFPNEKKFLDEKGAISFFVIRPRQYDYDHHESEISLRWHDFDDWIVNNAKTTNRITSQFKEFILTMKRGAAKIKSCNKTCPIFEFRKSLKNDLNLFGQEYITKKYEWSVDSTDKWLRKLMVWRDKSVYSTDNFSFSTGSTNAAYLAGFIAADGCIKDNAVNNNVILSLSVMDKCVLEKLKTFLKTEKPITSKIHSISKKSIFDLSTSNPFIIENLKLWNIKPRKSEREEVPWLIKNDLALIKAWIVGLIDGDGSIYLKNNASEKYPNQKPTLGISVLSSKEICDFISELIPVPVKVSKHKKTDLFEFKINNHYAVDFYNWLGRPNYGLTRKWGKIEEFKSVKSGRKTNKNEFSD